MKKVLIIILTVATLISCEKNNPVPNDGGNGSSNNQDCNCGVIVQQSEETELHDSQNWIEMYDTYKVKNNCSGNTKWFDNDTYTGENKVGDDWCGGYEW